MVGMLKMRLFFVLKPLPEFSFFGAIASKFLLIMIEAFNFGGKKKVFLFTFKYSANLIQKKGK